MDGNQKAVAQKNKQQNYVPQMFDAPVVAGVPVRYRLKIMD